jgi:nicotinamidase-related amidase
MDNQYPKTITLHLRTQFLGQRPGKYNAWQVSMVEKTLPYSQVAMIVCDMWDKHWSLGASERVNAMAPRMNAVLSMARARGATIIHAPSDTMEFFEGSPGRERALGVPKISTPAEIEHADFLLPVDDSDGGSDTGETIEKRVWTCQHPAVQINQEKDYISDDGLQVLAILRNLEIRLLLIMGVHTNMCILNRSFAIKQMVRWDMPVALVRDLTDSLYNPALPPYVSHDWGTALVVEYIEKFWCPTIISTNLFSAPLL